ncbi:MAG: DnaJ domain-containing protein [Lachnospiraceae bacterium]|nr:DnaJ domain-containing protein [Lachnospiraceae bacterium]
MNIWEILGIPPTEDIGKIKSAYAGQAKLYHPEEHPEEFKTLQSAYKIAVKLAKSKREGVPLTYLPSGQPTETNGQPVETSGQPMHGQSMETPGDMPESEKDSALGETEADISRREPESRKETEESVFDFSGVDAYGDREHFLRQFSLLAKNPYLRNRVEVWDYFLHQNTFAYLFSNDGFRQELVQTICSLSGWRRKTVLYLERFLSAFHTQENRPKDGQWETDCRAFRLKKLPKLWLPAFCTDRFIRKDGRNFHRHLRRRVCQMAGREIDLDVQLDLVRYIKLYLPYAEANEAYIDQLYRGWRSEQSMVFAAIVAVCFFAVVAEISFLQSGREAEVQMDYLMQLYGPEAESLSGEEKKTLRRDYNDYWRYAEEAIDDVLERYENWEEK